MAHGCTYCTDDFNCEKFTDEKHTSWCYGKDYPCKDRRITNADRIRSMSDEELAKWLDFLVNRAKIYGENKVWLEDTPRYYTDWLDWLQKENSE